MPQLHFRLTTQNRCPTLFLKRTPPTRFQIEWAYQHWSHFAEGNVFERSRSQLEQLAREGRIYQGEMWRGIGRATDLLCCSAIATDRVFNDNAVVELGFGIVNRAKRSNGFVQLTTAAAMTERILFDDLPAVAAVAITCRSAAHARRALLRAAARNLSAYEADERHPALGAFYRHCVAQNNESCREGGDPLFWLFGREAIQHQLNLIYQAGSENGLQWGGMIVRIEGNLAQPQVRVVLRKMITGEAKLPFEVLD